MLLTTGQFFFAPLSIPSPIYDYSLLLQNDELELVPGKNISVAFFVNESGNMTGIVSLQGKWVENTPTGVSSSIQPTTGVTPFRSLITFQSSILSNPGVYIYRISVQSETSNQSIDIHLNMTTDLTVQLFTDKAEYAKGQQIHLYGNATTFEENIVDSGDVIISIANAKKNILLTTQIQNDSYEMFYPISYGDTEGVWTVQIRVININGHIGIVSKSIIITTPPTIMRFAVDFYSPPNTAIYQRGDMFDISVYVTENLQSVRNATTFCTLPSLVTIPLIEYASGNYKQNYIIPWDAPTGEWFCTVDCIKNISGQVKTGGSALSIIIEPAPLQVTVLEPQTLQFSANSIIPFKVEIRYLDNSLMKTGTVLLRTSQGNITLQNENNGMYTTNISVTAQDVGSQVFEINAWDLFENKGEIKKIFLITSETQSTIILILIPLLAVGICGIIGFVFIGKMYRSRRVKTIREEMIETKRLQEEAAKKYYKEGSISKEIYEALIYEHTQRYAHLQKEERKITRK